MLKATNLFALGVAAVQAVETPLLRDQRAGAFWAPDAGSDGTSAVTVAITITISVAVWG